MSDNLKLVFSEGLVFVTDKKITVGELDPAVSYLLTRLNKDYGYNFKAEIIKIIQTDENYNVHISIKRDYNFECFKIRDGEIFLEIKKYLLKELPYNSFQKKILGALFKNKKSVTAFYENNRGLGVISKTIALYYKVYGKRVLFVGENISDEMEIFW